MRSQKGRAGRMWSAIAVCAMAVGLVSSPGPALAEEHPPCPSDFYQCRTPTVDFPGGTLAVDADVWGTQWGWWIVYREGDFEKVCKGNIDRARDPARSYLCPDLPAGRYFLGVYNAGWAATDGALRF